MCGIEREEVRNRERRGEEVKGNSEMACSNQYGLNCVHAACVRNHTFHFSVIRSSDSWGTADDAFNLGCKKKPKNVIA